ncbi:RpiB/LacA/LacB family sugar-phosphate isomerase, partial [Campylobacter lari]|nr:RpiB/LacA/LacB family sugar-phosphate isomerase [Campylobacter lari]
MYIASDHAGFILKQEIINFLQEKNINFEDLGPFSNDR